MKSIRSEQGCARAVMTYLKRCVTFLCLVCGTAATAQNAIEMRGLPAQAEGDVFAEVLVQPTSEVESVRMSIPGVLNRVERFAPYGLASDTRGKLNPFDSTAHADGDYVLTVTVTMRNGQTLSRQFPFAIRNQPAAAPALSVSVANLPKTVRGTVFPEIRVNLPVDSVRMVIDGHVDRTERHAPFGLMSDHNGRVNPFDSTRYTDGDYVLDFTIALKDGRRASASYTFSIDNQPAADSEPVVIDIPTVSIPPDPVDSGGAPGTPEPPLADSSDTPDTPVADPTPVAPPAPPQITVLGLQDGATVSGDLFVQATADRPVESIRFTVPGVLDRTERFAPYAVASDQGGQLNPWDTRQLPDGNQTLTVVVTAADGGTATREVSFIVDNASTAPAPPDDAQADASHIPTLTPGSGWSSSTAEPGRVGNAGHPGHPFRAIARWAVVPHQDFGGTFTIGVAAFHGYGIDRVAFSVENGPWVSRHAMIENPRTGVEEYCVNLDAARFQDGKITVRAIAYPHHGQPRLLGDLELYANAKGSLSFPVLELGPGRHQLPAPPKTDQGWYTVRPKPGVAKEDVIVEKVARSFTKRYRIQGVTLRLGQWDDIVGNNDNWIWLDGCDVTGNGHTNSTRWVATLWQNQYYTDCTFHQFATLFHGGGGNAFVRNVTATDIYEDIFRGLGYAANVTIDGVNTRESLTRHPDLFDFATGWVQDNMIFQNVQVRNANAQGFAGGNMKNIAFVDCNIQTPGWSVMQVGGDMTHVLIQNTVMNGGARLRNARPDGVVIRDSSIGWQPPFLPDGWDLPGVTVLPPPPFFD